jgi:hypothetical protein
MMTRPILAMTRRLLAPTSILLAVILLAVNVPTLAVDRRDPADAPGVATPEPVVRPASSVRTQIVTQVRK